jgi:hypothetical protein
MKFVENFAICTAASPVDTTGAAVAGNWVSLKGYESVTIIITQGAWAGGTPAVTLDQATAVAGTGSKTLGLTKYWSKVGLAAGDFTETAVSSDTFNLTTTNDTITVMQVHASELDVDNGFDCVQVDIASPGANADLISVMYILSGARYPQETVLDPLAD